MKLFQYLEEKLNENSLVKNVSIKIANATGTDDKIFKSSMAIKDFKNLISTELLKPSEETNELEESLIQIEFIRESNAFTIEFTSKKESETSDKIKTSLIKLEKNKDDARTEIKEWLKEKGIIMKTKSIENLVQLIYSLLEFKTEIPDETEKLEPKSKPEPTVEKEKSEKETKEPKSDESSLEEPKKETEKETEKEQA